MEPPARSNEIGIESLQFHEEIHQLMAPPPENASSFTALLELPPSQAVELLHGQEQSTSAASVIHNSPHKPYFRSLSSNEPTVSAFPAANSTIVKVEQHAMEVKDEPVAEESYSKPNFLSQPLDSDPMAENKGLTTTGKRKDREKKGKGSVKKSKTESSEDAEKLPYVHVRVRRGQATDSHSLAERARREKINARMKLLQELVPGCSKISGTALVLDEIINHVQSLQSQVELLSMRLAAVNPQIDFNLESLFAAETASVVDSNFHSMFIPLAWPEPEEAQANNESRQQHSQPQPWNFNSLHPSHQPVWVGMEEGNHHNFITPEISLLSYDSPANSVLSLHSKGGAAAAAEKGIMKVE